MTLPAILLRLEALAVLAGAVVLYLHLGGTWGYFTLLLLLPDLSMLGYLAGPRFGSSIYNGVHTLLAPAIRLR